jgi:hypothetical protein
MLLIVIFISAGASELKFKNPSVTGGVDVFASVVAQFSLGKDKS